MWSRPSGQRRRRERLPAPKGGGEAAASFPCPPQLADVAGSVWEVQGLRQGGGRAAQGRWERSPGEVTGNSREARNRGRRLPVSLTFCGTPGHIPLWASLLHLQPKRATQDGLFTAFTGHLLGAGSPPHPPELTPVWGRQTSKGFSERPRGRCEWQEAGPPWGTWMSPTGQVFRGGRGGGRESTVPSGLIFLHQHCP